MKAVVLLVALVVAGCATAPPAADPRATAAEVFRLSGGLDDLRLMARFAPMLVDREDVKAQCLQSMGREGNPLGRAVCDMAASAAEGLAKGEGGLRATLESQIDRMEARAVEALVDTYSPAELAAMRAYYASPEGRAIVSKRAEYLARLVGAR